MLRLVFPLLGYPGKEAAGFVDAVDLEKNKRQGDKEINNWIDKQLESTSVKVVLAGEKTCSSRWVNYEIQKSIEKGNGLLGIDVSKIKYHRTLRTDAKRLQF